MAYYRQAYAQKSRYNRASGLRKIGEKVIYRNGKDSNFRLGKYIVRVVPYNQMVQIEAVYDPTVTVKMYPKEGRNGQTYFYGKYQGYVVYINRVSAKASLLKVYAENNNRTKRGVIAW